MSRCRSRSRSSKPWSNASHCSFEGLGRGHPSRRVTLEHRRAPIDAYLSQRAEPEFVDEIDAHLPTERRIPPCQLAMRRAPPAADGLRTCGLQDALSFAAICFDEHVEFDLTAAGGIRVAEQAPTQR